ncbi:PIN-like domain-containing protein [uncultured Shewanella sp.]|uniref:PIN-like domain-containing protein n=1 Tax=uncultured Shewanella sp. TaxID=173975 RepID=UPI00260CF9E3|nr:PIN-like domain-containing protein [uncultured Shewanella sp.]
MSGLEKHHFSVVSEDQVRVKLDALFDGRIGEKPADQKAIDALEKKAELRFKNKVPPGYMDDDKEKSDEPVFSYGNLTYQRKYSDYIVWSQMLTHASQSNLSDLIFITDDDKEDWWLKVKQNGDKTISPRPELIGEMTEQADVQRFHMYSSEGFLKYANKILSVGVSSEAIEEVRDVARVRYRERNHHNMGRSAEKVVYDWLSEQYGEECLVNLSHAPVDIIAKFDGKTVAFEVKVVRHPRFSERLYGSIYEAHYFADKNEIDELVFVLVTFDVDHVESIKKVLERRLVEFPPIDILIGVAELDEETGMITDFTPYDKFRIRENNQDIYGRSRRVNT